MASAPQPTTSGKKRRLEPWVWVAIILAAIAAAQLIYLGQQPGGRGPILVYRRGLLATGILAGLTIVAGLIVCLRRPPALQRGRLLGLGTAAGSFFVSTLPFPYPSSHAGRPLVIPLSVPFEGEGRLVFGGEGKAPSPLVLNPARRFGWQFELPEVEGGAWVLAPCAGELLLPGSESAAGAPSAAVLEVAPERYLVIEPVPGGSDAALLSGRVERGQRLWRASAPLILYIQDTPDPGEGEGVPGRFGRYWQEGLGEVELGSPIAGRGIRTASSGAHSDGALSPDPIPEVKSGPR